MTEEFEKLKTALQNMKESGEDGFEGLVARLLGLLIDDTFLVARSGSQPSGDARSLVGGITIQAKRYKDETAVDLKRIEGDFREASRTLPDLDVYIIAITRFAQLQDLADRLKEETGIDVIIIGCSEEMSPLSLLCAAYWEKTTRWQGLRELKKDLKPWAETLMAKERAEEELEKLRVSIKQCLNTYNDARDAANGFLRRRFGFDDPGSARFSYSVNLPASVSRRNIEKEVVDWWKNNKALVAYLEGEEGTGKSWVAARAAWQMLEKGALVLWLDSMEWSRCRSLNDAIGEALKPLAPRDDKKQIAWLKKALKKWGRPILLVLDGVNERGAIEAAWEILEGYFNSPPPGLKILLTTRPLSNHPGYKSTLWGDCQKIEVGAYNDEELREALNRPPTPIEPEELSPSILEIAKVPRYLEVCIKLKDQLGSMENITKELVLYVELLNKIKNCDPQVREALDIRQEADAEEILQTLAKRAEHDTTKCPLHRGTQLLNECFSRGYAEVRQDLAEPSVPR